MDAICLADDPSTCDHEHRTIHDVDPLLGYLADAVARNGIKRDGVQYPTQSDFTDEETECS